MNHLGFCSGSGIFLCFTYIILYHQFYEFPDGLEWKLYELRTLYLNISIIIHIILNIKYYLCRYHWKKFSRHLPLVLSTFQTKIILNTIVKMSESTDVQALAKISTEVDESQIKVVFSSQCIKGTVVVKTTDKK